MKGKGRNNERKGGWKRIFKNNERANEKVVNRTRKIKQSRE